MAALNPPLPQNDPSDLSNDRLGFALCLALALHAAFILGISFSPEQRQAAATKLEITLSQYRSDKSPEEADFLAQSNQQGSGTLEEAAMLTTRDKAQFQDNTIREIAPQAQSSFSEAQQKTSTLLVTQTDSSHKQPPKETQQAQDEYREKQVNKITVKERKQEISSLEAKLDIQRQAYAKRPRIRRLTSVATKQSEDALYLHHWREKIESIGNQNYPQAAKQDKIYGELRLVVSLMSDGSVFDVKILASSGQKVLDQAAIRIVHLAAPYPPFPAGMRRKVDVLEIIRTWRFHQNKLTSRS
ncbi:MAG: protein TonB [Pseudohongiellaceae bacterium]|jgi:protein TonB